MRKAFMLALCAGLLLVAGRADEVKATPGRSSRCSNCHGNDPNVTVTVTLLRCNGTNAEYDIAVSNTYSGGEGWAIFNGSGSNIQNATGTRGAFTVDGTMSYTAYGVSDGSGRGGSDSTVIGPDCEAPTCTDADGDGYYAEDNCGTPVDCNDGDRSINPGVAEDCTDGIDNDCDGMVDTADPNAVNCPPSCTDLDGDGFFVEGGDCGPVDCDDRDPLVNPAAMEDCFNGLDDDCDGMTDDADPECPSCTDADRDGYYAEDGCGTEIDCDDGDRRINPGASEDCTDGMDNDCDGLTDADDPEAVGCPPICTDADADGFYAENGCSTPADCNDMDPTINPDALEDCFDGLDNDCDGQIDGSDGDCAPSCTDADNDGYYAEEGCGTAVDCDDLDPMVRPGAEEVCTDGVDNDCDGMVDMADPGAVGCPAQCTDADADDYNVEGGGCGPADCDDQDSAVNPGASEDCSNGLDDDCDGLVDDEDTDCGACVPTHQKESGKRCSDTIDNDCDGATDYADPDCSDATSSSEVCDDGVDNDGDGKIDCEDRRDCGRARECRRGRGGRRER
jgi:hypothetical protein